jgi:pyruvate dehydrogenase E1 component beta subunit
MAVMTMVEAIRSALGDALQRDERVIVLGQDVGVNGGVFRATEGLQERFGEDRVVDMPLAEAVIVGSAVGLACSGLVPIPELQFMGFGSQAFHQIEGQVARYRFRSQGAYPMPMVIRAPFGGNLRTPELHSDAHEAKYVNAPGLKVVMPATARDAKGLLAEAIRDPDPVLFCEPLRGYRLIKDEVPDEDYTVPLGSARMAREGSDLVIVAYSAAVAVAEQAAARAEQEGYSVGVLDLRSLVPLDVDALREAVATCGRAIVLHEASLSAGFGAELVATIQEEAFWSLQAPVGRVAAYDTPYPPATIEGLYIPSVDRVLDAVRTALEARAEAARRPPAPEAARAALEFRLPDVGEGIATAEIVAWQVAEGDRVREHDDLVEIQTDKATVVIPCPATGVVTSLCAAEGEVLDVGALLAVIEREAGDRAAAPGTARRATAASDTAPPAAAQDTAPPAAAQDTAPPAAAQDTAPPATAPGLGAPAPTTPAQPAGEVVPLRGIRRTIAHTLTRAWNEVPRIIDFREVDATALLRARERLRERAVQRGDEALARALTPTPMVVRAAVRALAEHPYVNASIDLEREEITLHRRCHVGIATAGPDGLTVPVVHDADRRSLDEIALEIVALASAARERRLRPDQLAGPTFTVNNFGSLGTWMGTPIVRPPEVANLGVGAIRDRVVAVDGSAVVRPTLVLSVAGDHRVLDGDTLGAFVARVAELLGDPNSLLDDPA